LLKQPETKASSVDTTAEKKTLVEASDGVTSQLSDKIIELSDLELESETDATAKPQDNITQAAPPVSDNLESMNSEMAVILSQAESQGYAKIDETAANKPLTASVLSTLVEEGTDTVASSKAATVEDAVVVATADISAVARPSSNTHITAEATQDSISSASDNNRENVAETVSVKTNASTDTETNMGEVTSSVVTDYAGEDDLSAYSQYAGAQDIGFDGIDFDFDAADSAPLPQDPLSPAAVEQNTVVAKSKTENSANTETSTTTDVDLSDDILDAVLAARDSLLDGLGEDEPKESSTKKSVKERKAFAPPVRKPKPEPEEPSQPSNAIEQADNNSDIIDRPPWEEPHEQDLTPRFKGESAAHAAESPANAAVAAPSQQNNETAKASDKPTAMQLDSTPVQDVALNLPALPSGELSGNDIDLKWYRFMAELEVGGRVRQLAVNSVCHQFEQPLSLLLKPDQKHLAADVAIKQFEEAMSEALGEPSEVRVSVGVDSTRETPLEVRRRFHKEILVQAHHGLMTDDNVRWLAQHMGAQLTPDTLTYAPELLVNKGKLIELVDMSNFKRLPES